MEEEKVLEIITDYDALSEVSSEIDIRKSGEYLRKIILDLKKMIAEKDLKGLAAPQLGYKFRVICLNFGKDDIRTYINPIIADCKGLGLSRETCESIPGKMYIRPRNTEVRIMYQTPLGKPMTQTLKGKAAVIMQELIDHLDGLLLSDVGLEIGEDWDSLSEDQKTELIDLYLKSLDLKHKDILDSIEADPEAKSAKDAADFMKAVQSGEIKVEVDKIPKVNKDEV